MKKVKIFIGKNKENQIKKIIGNFSNDFDLNANFNNYFTILDDLEKNQSGFLLYDILVFDIDVIDEHDYLNFENIVFSLKKEMKIILISNRKEIGNKFFNIIKTENIIGKDLYDEIDPILSYLLFHDRNRINNPYRLKKKKIKKLLGRTDEILVKKENSNELLEYIKKTEDIKKIEEVEDEYYFFKNVKSEIIETKNEKLIKTLEKENREYKTLDILMKIFSNTFH